MTANRPVCVSCAAPLSIGEDVSRVTCPYCSAAMVVDRGGGFPELKGAQQVSRAGPPPSPTERSTLLHVTAPGRAKVAPAEEKDWTTTLGLCAFLGWLGIHRFYTGPLLIGLLQMVTLGGFYLWWLFDLFQILTGRYRDGNGLSLANRNSGLAGGLLYAITAFVSVSVVGAIVAFVRDTEALMAAALLLAVVAAGLAFPLGYWRKRKT